MYTRRALDASAAGGPAIGLGVPARRAARAAAAAAVASATTVLAQAEWSATAAATRRRPWSTFERDDDDGAETVYDTEIIAFRKAASRQTRIYLCARNKCHHRRY